MRSILVILLAFASIRLAIGMLAAAARQRPRKQRRTTGCVDNLVLCLWVVFSVMFVVVVLMYGVPF